MLFCTTCGTENARSSAFCSNCGSRLKLPKQPAEQAEQCKPQSSQTIEVPQQNYQPQSFVHGQYMHPPQGLAHKSAHTGWLTFVIVLNWFTFIVIAFISIISIIFGSVIENSFFGGFGIIGMAVAITYIWVIKEMGKYNNTARKVNIALIILVTLITIGDSSLIFFVLIALQLYALIFHKKTVNLFTQ